MTFYLTTVFTLSWATTSLGYSRPDFLVLQLVSVIFFAGFIPVSAVLSDRRNRASAMIIGSVGIILFGLVLGPMLQAGSTTTVIALSVGMALMGTCFGSFGTLMSDLFPAEVRYTGSSLAFNLAGILGASFAPYIATRLATDYGLQFVGYYLSGMALMSLLALLKIRSLLAAKHSEKFLNR